MMASRPSPSPPKPWERSGIAPAAASSPLSVSSIPSPAIPTSTIDNSSGAISTPILPDRPAGMNSNTSGYGQSGAYGSRYGSTNSPYGASSSPYGSSYSRLGQSSYGSGYGSSMGSYGSMGMGMGGYGSSSYGGGYGGMGGGYGGMSSYGGMGGMNSYGGGYGMGGMGMNGMNGMNGMGGPNDISLSQRMEVGTAATFQIIQSIVSAFGGFSQMLESTFMATHSSFFAMIGVAEQFGHLRNYLGQVLSIFALVRWCRGLLNKILGREGTITNGSNSGISADGFKAFESGIPTTSATNGSTVNNKPRLAKKPLIIFLLTVIGLPWLMTKLVRIITLRQEEEARLHAINNPQSPYQQGPPLLDQFGRPLPPSQQPQQQQLPIDPSTLTFVRGTFAYEATNPEELNIAPNEIIAVLTPLNERTTPGWWRGRLRDGTVGWFPSTHVSDIPVKGAVTPVVAKTVE